MDVYHQIIIGTSESRKVEVGELLRQHLGINCENSYSWVNVPTESQRSTLVGRLGEIAEESVIVAGDSVPMDEDLVAFIKIFGRVIYLDTGPAAIQNPRSEGDNGADVATATTSPERDAALRKTARRIADLIIKISQDDTPEAILEKIKERIGS